ncbi:MAG: AAA family ATPase [Flavobacterium sp.]
MEKITITNFRKIKETWELNLAPITFLTGTNNSGKSSVMKALMLLDGFGNSKNHFILNFNQKHSRNHKIDCFSNAINRENLKGKLFDIKFSIENKNFNINYIFYPYQENDSMFEKGKLKLIEFINKEDSSVLNIKNITGDDYQLTIDNSFINGKYQDDDTSNLGEEVEVFLKYKIEIESDLKNNESILKELDETGVDRIHRLNLIKSLKEKLKDVNKQIKKIDTKKTKDVLQFNPTFSLNEFEGQESLDRILRRVLNKYFRDNEKKIGLTNSNSEMFRISLLADNILDSLNLSISHLTPNRNTQTRLYVNDNGNNDIYDIIKSISEISIKKRSEADIFIKKWMSKDFFDIGEDYDIKSIEGLASKIEIKENGYWINLVDKGFGAGQIFTILLRIADVINQEFTKNNQRTYRRLRKATPIILIEEPEANLHPAFQSRLAELFLETWKEYGIQFIVETHSEYIIRKSQLLFVDYANPQESLLPAMRIQHNPFVVYYFDKNGPYEMKYKNDGSFNKPFGEGFLDVVDDIALEIFLKNNRQ